jgi:hypothetical protein
MPEVPRIDTVDSAVPDEAFPDEAIPHERGYA